MRAAALAPYAFIAPAALLLLAFGTLPLALALGVSFTDLDLAGLADPLLIRFVGPENYRELMADPAFWQALANTGAFALVGVPSVVAVSLAVALLLNRSDHPFFRALRAFYFVPAVTAIVAVSLVWGYLYNAQFGLLNHLLSLAGLGPVRWLTDPVVVKLSVALVAIWRGTGLNIVIFLAALRAIPREYLEAAALDGASELRRTVSIVLPLLRFAILFVTVTTTIGWLQFFDEPFVLTRGGPLGASTSVSLFLYQEGFSAGRFGYAGAGTVVLLVVISGFTLLQLRGRRADARH
ncbi:carbohydrate ABC transporter permease [Nonomuraea sp. NPDC050783]|uniref:carbohydrate ABC transporter permease n=1 Tax=Nonomuraea sp. NPDC050783 TaxID=3154634 RepID=UPI003465F3F6